MRKLLSLDNRAWSASFFNVLAMASQFWTLWTTRNIGGTSLVMMVIFLYVQITFAQVGYRTKSRALFWGMVVSALFTTAIIVLMLYVRFFGPLQLPAVVGPFHFYKNPGCQIMMLGTGAKILSGNPASALRDVGTS